MKRSIIKSFLIGLIFSVTALCGILMLNNFKTDRKVEVKADSVTGTEISASDSGSQYYGNEYRGQIIVKSGSTYTMTGGVIDGASGMFGSAFYVENGATLDLAGGSIINNHSKWGVIYIEEGGSLNISGDFKFLNNEIEQANVICGETAIPVCAENLSDVSVLEGATITESGTKTEIYNVEVIICAEQSDGTKTYIKQTKDCGCSFADYDIGVDLNNYNGYFTDTQYLDVLDEDVNLFETYQTGRLYVYTKQATVDMFTYTVSSLLETSSVTLKTSAAGEIVFPATYQDFPVTSFSWPTSGMTPANITGYVFSSNISQIKQECLLKTSLTTLNVHNNVTNFVAYSNVSGLGWSDFTGKNQLLNINISDKNNIYIDFNSNGIFKKSDASLVLGCVKTDLTKKFAGAGGKKINKCAFLGVPISSITIPSSVKTIEGGAFASSGLANIDISSVTSLGEFAFARCLSLENVRLSDNLATIKSTTFGNCSKLQTINIPSLLNTIEMNAFMYCYELSGEIILPSTFTSLAYGAFYNCRTLNYLYLPANLMFESAVTSTWDLVFQGCTNLTIATAVDQDYATSNWGSLWNYRDASNYCTTYYGITLAEGQTIADAIAAAQTGTTTTQEVTNLIDVSAYVVPYEQNVYPITIFTFDAKSKNETEVDVEKLKIKKYDVLILIKEENDK